MTMWGPHAGFGEDIPKLVANDPQSKRRRSRRRAWREGLSDQTVVKNFEDVRAYRAFERAVIGSVDPRITSSRRRPPPRDQSAICDRPAESKSK
jgi:hypothetical protein